MESRELIISVDTIEKLQSSIALVSKVTNPEGYTDLSKYRLLDMYTSVTECHIKLRSSAVLYPEEKL